MYPYQLSKVLADEHIHDLLVAAERHERRAAARRNHRDRTEPFSRLKVVTARIARTMAKLNVGRDARARSTATSLSDAGPMGCST